MRKIPTMFIRDGGRVVDAVTPGCQWAVAGAGVATRKYDGTCVMLDESGVWWSRRQVRPSRREPDGFVPVETDPATGKRFGWEPAGQSPYARQLADAVVRAGTGMSPGTYELCGPNIQRNPEGLEHNRLYAHARAGVLDVPDRSFGALQSMMSDFPHEGVVFKHADGRAAKIKRRDFR